jgi:hypothetical protein
MVHQPGIVYATTSDGLELPIIDITHPTFAIPDDPASRAALIKEYNEKTAGDTRGPIFLRRLFMKLGARRSRLLRALIEPAGSFLGGLTTYIMKLGPDNLPDGFNTPLDQRIVGSPHARFVRLRLQHCAMMLVDGLDPLLAAQPKASLHFLSIGGGPAMDCINALLLFQKTRPDLLTRPIHIHVCDLDNKGPAFGANAVKALLSAGAPLQGLNLTFDTRLYNWDDTTTLTALLNTIEPDAIVATSSEGALFEYSSDQAIIANLRALHPRTKLVVGSVTSSLPIRREQIKAMRFAIHPRGLEGFRPLAELAEYTIDRAEVTPLSDHLLMRPR